MELADLYPTDHINWILHIISLALLNPCRSPSHSQNYLITSGKVQVPWDAEEFSLRAKATVEKHGWASPSNESLLTFFPKVEFGHIVEPAIIIDRHGRIIMWYLPNIMSHVVVGVTLMLLWQSFPKSTASPFSTMQHSS
jgi:hypothetical protein